MIFRDSSSGMAVGFYDNFNMNASAYRNRVTKGLVSGERMIEGTPFDIYYGTLAKPRHVFGSTYLWRQLLRRR